MKDANKLIFSPDDLAVSLHAGVQALAEELSIVGASMVITSPLLSLPVQVYAWQGFLRRKILSPSNRRWHVNELARHSNELAIAFSQCLDSPPTLSKDFVEDPNG